MLMMQPAPSRAVAAADAYGNAYQKAFGRAVAELDSEAAQAGHAHVLVTADVTAHGWTFYVLRGHRVWVEQTATVLMHCFADEAPSGN